MSSKWTDRAIIKNALQMMDGLAVPDRHTLFAAIFAVGDHRCGWRRTGPLWHWPASSPLE
jgi:hypothetical protein